MKLFVWTFVLCVLEFCGNVASVCSDCGKEGVHIRVKRGKYFPGPPPKFNRRPPLSYPNVSGAYSYTPPPGYMMNDDEPQHPGNRPHKSSKRPPPSENDNLREEDINNIIRYLSKKDLEKVVQLAGHKIKTTDNYNNEVQPSRVSKREGTPQFEVREVEADPQYTLNGPYVKHTNGKDYNFNKFVETKPTYQNYNGQEYSLGEESMQRNEFAFLNSHIEKEILGDNDSRMQEESLPKPVNLRESDDFDVSFSKNVPTIVKANDYRVESFGDLPLMDYHSKMHTVSSYKVPHYTVTSPQPSLPNVPPPSPQLELAPPASQAQSQSDAHLKAIKIWSHRSKGTAYTLHDDGTLSLELGYPKYG